MIYLSKEVSIMNKGGKIKKGHGKNKTLMTPEAAARIQRASAKSSGGKVSKGSFTTRAQRAAAKNSGK